MESITLPYAILFQEFHHVHMMDESPPYYDRLGVASTLRRLWVICSFLLVISFAGNLKATSVVKTFEDPTDSVQKIRERCTVTDEPSTKTFVHAATFFQRPDCIDEQ